MADYQSLLARAVANLPPTSTAAARQAIYDRARKALVTQLRSLRPPLPEADITREETALDRAIEAVEGKFAPADALQAADAALHGADVVSAPAAPTPPPTAKSPPPPAASALPAAPREAPSEKPAATRPPPLRPPPSQPVEPRMAPVRPSAHIAATRPPPAPAEAQHAGPPVAVGDPPAPPAIHVSPPSGDGAAAPPVIAGDAGGGAPAPENLAAVVPSDPTQPVDAPDAPRIVADRADEAESEAPALETPLDEERLAAGRSESEGLRPVAPSAPVETGRSWPWAALAVVIGIVLSVAIAAILMRQKPQDLALNPPPGPPPEVQQAPAKIAQRAQPSPDAAPAPAPGASPAQTEQPSTEGPAPANPPSAPPAAAQAPNAGRAAMLIASADNPQKPVVNLGSTVWSILPAPQGQPAAMAVEADADIPDLKMHASMILRKNTDPTLQATHTIDLKFTFQDGAPFNGFKDVGLPQMRKLDSTASEALNSVKVKISDDYFMFALAKGDQDVARNIDLMRTSAWLDFPLLLNDNRIAKLVFQKSADGAAMLDKAFEAWK